jgi:hypothetical protein
MKSKTWFEVDREGLAQTVRRRHPGFIFGELVANAMDQPGTKNLFVEHSPVPNKSLVNLTVRDDDPTGFADLQDAYTLFRRTPKRADSTVRGRFNLGEKEFLSICQEAKIQTTIGTVFFNADGTRRISRAAKDKRDEGTEVTAVVKMTREDYAKAVEFLDMIITPSGINIVRSCRVEGSWTDAVKSASHLRETVGDFEVQLPTEIEDEDGDLRKTKRKSRVIVTKIPQRRPDDTPWLFEMGIPVCPIEEDTWDIDVQQKVPLARDRDSVTPGYLRQLRVAVLNNCHDELDEEESTQAWVTEAIADEDVEQDAFKSVFENRFGEDAVVYDPSDKEANDRALADGRKIIYGGSIPKGAHDNVKRFGEVPTAGAVFPTSKAVFGPGGNNVDVKMTPTQKALCSYTEWLGQKLMGLSLDVRVVNSKQGFAACYGDQELLYNLRSLGKAWFRSWQKHFVRVHELIIHEFAHEYEESHLSDDYHKACCKLGAKLAKLMLEDPDEVHKRMGLEATADV